jgi:hypothetical protein
MFKAIFYIPFHAFQDKQLIPFGFACYDCDAQVAASITETVLSPLLVTLAVFSSL